MFCWLKTSFLIKGSNLLRSSGFDALSTSFTLIESLSVELLIRIIMHAQHSTVCILIFGYQILNQVSGARGKMNKKWKKIIWYQSSGWWRYIEEKLNLKLISKLVKISIFNLRLKMLPRSPTVLVWFISYFQHPSCEKFWQPCYCSEIIKLSEHLEYLIEF